jgi:DNA-binding MarR family transcriptional regulator
MTAVDVSRPHVLLVEFSIASTQLVASTLGPHNTSNLDVQVFLAIHDGSGPTPSELADRLGVDRTALSRSLRRLRSENLVSHTADRVDGRSIHLRLTRAGRARVSVFESRLAQMFVCQARLVREVLASLGQIDEPAPDLRVTPLEAAFALADAGTAYVADATELVRPLGISTTTDRFAVSLIHQERAIRPARLADRLGLTTGGTSALIDRLERADLAVRGDAGESDRRGVLITLTGRGYELAVGLLDVFRRHSDSLCRALRLTLHVTWSGPGPR